MFDLASIDRGALEAALTPAPGTCPAGYESASMYGHCVVELMEAASILQRLLARESTNDVDAASIQAAHLLRRLGQTVPAPRSKARKTLGLRLSR